MLVFVSLTTVLGQGTVKDKMAKLYEEVNVLSKSQKLRTKQNNAPSVQSCTVNMFTKKFYK